MPVPSGSTGSGFGGINFGGLGEGIGGFLGGLFGNSGDPYKDAMKQYQNWANQAQKVQNPFLQMGQGAIPQFQQWLQGQQDPSGFINKLMGQYNESPWAKYQQEQAMRAAQNQGAAGGLTGSTPLMQFAQQQAHDISSEDMSKWLANVLGINTQYGQGLGSEIQGGQNAANSLTSMYGDMGRQMAEAAYGKRAGEQQDKANMWGGLFKAGSSLFGF